MRYGLLAVALLSLFQCRVIGAAAGDGPVDYTQVALKKAVEESVGTPLSEFWKDFYDFLVRKKGARALRRIRYAVSDKPLQKASYFMFALVLYADFVKRGKCSILCCSFLQTAGLRKNDPLELSRFLMKKLKDEVFSGYVGEEMWDSLTMELYYILREWWSKTPENPKDAAELGAWHALVQLYKELMAPTLRGSPRVEDINKLLLDPELELLKEWINEWKGVRPNRRDTDKERHKND